MATPFTRTNRPMTLILWLADAKTSEIYGKRKTDAWLRQ